MRRGRHVDEAHTTSPKGRREENKRPAVLQPTEKGISSVGATGKCRGSKRGRTAEGGWIV